MKKTPEFTLKKKTKNNKKTQTYKMFKKSQNQTWKARYRVPLKKAELRK